MKKKTYQKDSGRTVKWSLKMAQDLENFENLPPFDEKALREYLGSSVCS